MKCALCDGKGKYKNCLGVVSRCYYCHGTGEVNDKGERNMTNEEWLKQCNTEQLVHVIHLMTTSCYVCGKEGVDYKRCYFHKKCTGPKEIEEWLKEPHDPFE